mmetsp:Transcript_58989/g.68242  ORF Transcript_58989/g.68242 Transcript_58989/m.68242 type:complete len:86 (-) Transcript_58989:1657-1914(-)
MASEIDSACCGTAGCWGFGAEDGTGVPASTDIGLASPLGAAFKLRGEWTQLGGCCSGCSGENTKDDFPLLVLSNLSEAGLVACEP